MVYRDRLDRLHTQFYQSLMQVPILARWEDVVQVSPSPPLIEYRAVVNLNTTSTYLYQHPFR